MKPNQFGQIVKSLRKERLDWSTLNPWTQHQLSKEANLSTDAIRKIEQGKRANLTRNELTYLADALRLSTLERQEFMSAAIDNGSDKVSTLADGQSALDHVWDVFSNIQMPAYLIDPLHNMMGVNSAFMAYRGLTNETIDQACETEVGCNVLALLFRNNSTLRNHMKQRWDTIARSNLHQFRFTVLRYRHLPSFDRLIRYLKQQPGFSQLWLETRESPVDFYSQLRVFDYHHMKLGNLHYTTTMSTTLTQYGPLYTIVFVPCNNQTACVFNNLSEVNRGCRKVMAWPSLG